MYKNNNKKKKLNFYFYYIVQFEKNSNNFIEKREKWKVEEIKEERWRKIYVYIIGEKHMLPRGKHGKLLMGRYGAKVVEQRASKLIYIHI